MSLFPLKHIKICLLNRLIPFAVCVLCIFDNLRAKHLLPFFPFCNHVKYANTLDSKVYLSHIYYRQHTCNRQNFDGCKQTIQSMKSYYVNLHSVAAALCSAVKTALSSSIVGLYSLVISISWFLNPGVINKMLKALHNSLHFDHESLLVVLK